MNSVEVILEKTKSNLDLNSRELFKQKNLRVRLVDLLLTYDFGIVEKHLTVNLSDLKVSNLRLGFKKFAVKSIRIGTKITIHFFSFLPFFGKN